MHDVKPILKTAALLAALLTTLQHAAPAAAQNLLTNSQLNSTTGSWIKITVNGTSTVAFDASRDANSSPRSGSVALANTSPSGNIGVWLAQCHPAAPGDTFVWGGQLRFREGETATGDMTTGLTFFSEPGCTGYATRQGDFEPYPVATGRGVWRDSGAGRPALGETAPAATQSVRFFIRVRKTTIGGVLTVNADKLFLAYLGSPTCEGQVPTLIGSDGPDTLQGTPGTDIIMGFGGADEIFAGRGFDTVCGGGGADTLDGGPGTDILNGGAGEDVLLGGGGIDLLLGGGGNDACMGGAGVGDLAANCEVTSGVP